MITSAKNIPLTPHFLTWISWKSVPRLRRSPQPPSPPSSESSAKSNILQIETIRKTPDAIPVGGNGSVLLSFT
ncbi:hypothetical protein CEXT_632841 [Caerostris extrusa]|uniref:Uncharacterized protein n=1 Tax=Caerostris extrusa TaxID=172846 RepID=A0AAV4VWL1_CAEEX|nr:hypothetical protein CEXT_632841 [Caerostris extrusa]